jgi:hypothetical protein
MTAYLPSVSILFYIRNGFCPIRVNGKNGKTFLFTVFFRKKIRKDAGIVFSSICPIAGEGGHEKEDGK